MVMLSYPYKEVTDDQAGLLFLDEVDDLMYEIDPGVDLRPGLHSKVRAYVFPKYGGQEIQIGYGRYMGTFCTFFRVGLKGGSRPLISRDSLQRYYEYHKGSLEGEVAWTLKEGTTPLEWEIEGEGVRQPFLPPQEDLKMLKSLQWTLRNHPRLLIYWVKPSEFDICVDEVRPVPLWWDEDVDPKLRSPVLRYNVSTRVAVLETPRVQKNVSKDRWDTIAAHETYLENVRIQYFR
jgi:hypothetical protein